MDGKLLLNVKIGGKLVAIHCMNLSWNYSANYYENDIGLTMIGLYTIWLDFSK